MFRYLFRGYRSILSTACRHVNAMQDHTGRPADS